METKSDALVTPAVVKHERNGVRSSEAVKGTALPRRIVRICSSAFTSERVTGTIVKRQREVRSSCEGETT